MRLHFKHRRHSERDPVGPSSLPTIQTLSSSSYSTSSPSLSVAVYSRESPGTALPAALQALLPPYWADVNGTLLGYAHGRGKEQQTFDQLLELLLKASPRPHLMMGEAGTSEADRRWWRVKQVQMINDSLTSLEAIAWFRRALELSL